MDGQTKDFPNVGLQGRRELFAFKILWDQGVIGGFEPMLHGQIQAGGRFATSTDTHQNHIRQSEISVELAIVVRQAVIDGLNSIMVLLAFTDIRKAPDTVMRLDPQLILQGIDKGAEHVKQHAFAVELDHIQNIHINQSRENNGFLPLNFGSVIDLANGLMSLVHRVDERQPHMTRFKVKLSQDGVAKGLSRDACAIGYKENASVAHQLLSQ
jgi:hypothetical protein